MNHDPKGTTIFKMVVEWTSREMLLCTMLFLMFYLQIRCPAAENLAGELGNRGQEQADQPLRADCCSPRWSSPRCQELRHVLGVSSNQYENESFHNKHQFQLLDFDHVGFD